MANTQDIRRRIKSIRNTAQITKAMQMVAASKMRKAQQHALAGRPYAALMNKVLVSLQERTDPQTSIRLLADARGQEGAGHHYQHRQGPCRRAQHQPVREAASFDTGQDRLRHRRPQSAPIRCADASASCWRIFELKDAPTFLETKPIAKFAHGNFLERRSRQGCRWFTRTSLTR